MPAGGRAFWHLHSDSDALASSFSAEGMVAAKPMGGDQRSDRIETYAEVILQACEPPQPQAFLRPFKDYCLGLLMPVEHKSVERLATMIAPGRMGA